MLLFIFGSDLHNQAESKNYKFLLISLISFNRKKKSHEAFCLRFHCLLWCIATIHLNCTSAALTKTMEKCIVGSSIWHLSWHICECLHLRQYSVQTEMQYNTPSPKKPPNVFL